MPQIWLSYSELADHLTCTEASARERAASNAWDRRRCSDGLTRVKLKPHLADQYLAHLSGARIPELLDIIATLEALLLRQVGNAAPPVEADAVAPVGAAIG
jgi:hypothetical protein